MPGVAGATSRGRVGVLIGTRRSAGPRDDLWTLLGDLSGRRAWPHEAIRHPMRRPSPTLNRQCSVAACRTAGWAVPGGAAARGAWQRRTSGSGPGAGPGSRATGRSGRR